MKRPPRSYLVSPPLFGHDPTAKFHQPTTLEELVGLRQAEVQNAFCNRVRLRLLELSITQKEAAEATGFAYNRLNDCLAGRRRLSLADTQRIELVTGPLLVGLKVHHTVVADAGLRSRFPEAVGKPEAEKAAAAPTTGPQPGRPPTNGGVGRPQGR